MIRRAATLAAFLALVSSGAASADSILGDADTVTAGTQGFVNVGTLPAGGTRTVQVGFELDCLGLSHVDPGVAITLTPTGTPPAGGAVSATAVSIGPVPATWPADGLACVDDPVLAGGTASLVTLTAPTTPGFYVYRVTYSHSPGDGLTGTTLVQLGVTVDANTAPELVLPQDYTVEADAPGGWTAAYTATATDVEDDPDPVATCAPAPGVVLPLGTTVVSCTATDTAGATVTGSFSVTVVDTTPPVIDTSPNLEVTTTSDAGAAVAFATPGALDLVDGTVPVDCTPASGSLFAVGDTAVTCSAADRSGNRATSSFWVTVRLEPVIWVTWSAPASGPELVATRGRVVPLRAIVRVNGLVLGASGGQAPQLVLERLDAARGPVGELRSVGVFRWMDGAWMARLDTSMLDGGTWRVQLVIDGQAVDGTVLQVVVPGNEHRPV